MTEDRERLEDFLAHMLTAGWRYDSATIGYKKGSLWVSHPQAWAAWEAPAAPKMRPMHVDTSKIAARLKATDTEAEDEEALMHILLLAA